MEFATGALRMKEVKADGSSGNLGQQGLHPFRQLRENPATGLPGGEWKVRNRAERGGRREGASDRRGLSLEGAQDFGVIFKT
jgi:hypothetical protein